MGDLHTSLAAQGFALAPKRLRPHVTLARHVSQSPELPALPAFTWAADAFLPDAIGAAAGARLIQ